MEGRKSGGEGGIRTPDTLARFQESAVKSASDRGLVPGWDQCIGFSTPVVFAEGGGLDSAHIADLYEQVAFLGDIHRQIADVPDGGKVRLIVSKPASKP
jgi:hypothetical protein